MTESFQGIHILPTPTHWQPETNQNNPYPLAMYRLKPISRPTPHSLMSPFDISVFLLSLILRLLLARWRSSSTLPRSLSWGRTVASVRLRLDVRPCAGREFRIAEVVTDEGYPPQVLFEVADRASNELDAIDQCPLPIEGLREPNLILVECQWNNRLSATTHLSSAFFQAIVGWAPSRGGCATYEETEGEERPI